MIVCDSSPLIALAYLGKLQILDRMFKECRNCQNSKFLNS